MHYLEALAEPDEIVFLTCAVLEYARVYYLGVYSWRRKLWCVITQAFNNFLHSLGGCVINNFSCNFPSWEKHSSSFTSLAKTLENPAPSNTESRLGNRWSRWSIFVCHCHTTNFLQNSTWVARWWMMCLWAVVSVMQTSMVVKICHLTPWIKHKYIKVAKKQVYFLKCYLVLWAINLSAIQNPAETVATFSIF